MCHSSLKDIHHNLQAVSGTFSEVAEPIPPLVRKASFSILDQLSSTWNSWMGEENDTVTREIPSDTKNMQNHHGKVDHIIRRTKRIDGQQQADHDATSAESNNSDDSFPIREISSHPNEEGSLCFQENDMGSAVHDAIAAQYVEQPYVNGKKILVNTWDKTRGRSKFRMSLTSWGKKNRTSSSREAERERKQNKALARSLSRERSKEASRSRSRSSNRNKSNCQEYDDEEREEVIRYEPSPNVDGKRDSSTVLIHHY
jgi:hypothetical protein